MSQVANLLGRCDAIERISLSRVDAQLAQDIRAACNSLRNADERVEIESALLELEAALQRLDAALPPQPITPGWFQTYGTLGLNIPPHVTERVSQQLARVPSSLQAFWRQIPGLIDSVAPEAKQVLNLRSQLLYNLSDDQQLNIVSYDDQVDVNVNNRLIASYRFSKRNDEWTDLRDQTVNPLLDLRKQLQSIQAAPVRTSWWEGVGL